MAGASSGARKSLERARSLHQKGDLAEAERLVQSVLQRNGADVDALQHMALLQAQCGALEPARQYVDRALGLEPARAELHYLRAEIAGSLGWPEQESATEPVKPLIEVTVVVVVPLLPAEMVRLDGLTATAKSGVTGAPGVTVRQVLARV